MKKYLLFLVIAVIGGIVKVSAQQPSEKLKQIFLDAEYFYLYEDYEEALFSYNTLYKRGFSDNGNINYRIGQCYLNIPGEKYKAVPYLLKAVKKANIKYTEGSFKEVNAPYDSYYYLGVAYLIDNKLDSAQSCFEKFKTLIGPKNIEANVLADNELKSVFFAREAMNKSENVSFTDLDRPVSTNSRDMYPAVSGDESVIVYNSAQKFYDAIFYSKKVNNKWSNPINITPEVQSDGNQYVSSLSFDGKQLLLRYEDNFEADIWSSSFEEGKWTKSKRLNKNINSKFFESNACISKDGNTLYFSSNRSGGIGALDIYKSTKMANGDWGVAVNLGKNINTDLNEDLPEISEDGKKLFFISQGHNTMGGYDIFCSELDSTGNWGIPKNLGYPINTTDDDMSFYPVKNGTAAYASLFRRGSYGREDLYRISISETPVLAEVKKDTTPPVVEKENTKQIEINRELPEEVVNEIPKDVETEKEKELIVLRSVFFDFNSADINIAAQKELEHLGLVLANYVDLKIQFIGYTDAIGSDRYNNILSEKRAQSVKNFLIKKGVNADRIQIKGAGKTNYIAVNENADGTDNPEGRKYNRRVEIHWIGFKPENISVESTDVPEHLKVKK
jgi:outer membrane protein OmpA-like peptidoglycan-associated protein